MKSGIFSLFILCWLRAGNQNRTPFFVKGQNVQTKKTLRLKSREEVNLKNILDLMITVRSDIWIALKWKAMALIVDYPLNFLFYFMVYRNFLKIIFTTPGYESNSSVWMAKIVPKTLLSRTSITYFQVLDFRKEALDRYQDSRRECMMAFSFVKCVKRLYLCVGFRQIELTHQQT